MARVYYPGSSVGPYFLCRFLEGLGFTLQSDEETGRCLFRRSAPANLANEGRLALFPLILSRPRYEPFLIPGDFVDQNIFVHGSKRNLIPPHWKRVWNDTVDRIAREIEQGTSAGGSPMCSRCPYTDVPLNASRLSE